MKKKTKASQRRLNNLLIILLLMAVLLIMSTYAWFTANRTVKIDTIDVTVTTSSGLQISANGIDWKTVLATEDLALAHEAHDSSAGTGGYTDVTYNFNQLPKYVAPVSTVLNRNPNNGNHLDMFFGNVGADLESDPDAAGSTYGQNLLTATRQTDTLTSGFETTESENYYLAFDIFLKLDANTQAGTADDIYIGGAVAETTDVVKGSENAARVAIVKGGNTTELTDTSVIHALSTDGVAMLWEPNYDCHTAQAIQHATALGWASGIQAGTGQAQVDYSGVMAECDKILEKNATAALNPTYFKDVEPTWATTKAETVDLKMAEGLNSGVTKFRIYMWIEGQDIDCENYASGAELGLDLGFSLDAYSDGNTKNPGTTY